MPEMKKRDVTNESELLEYLDGKAALRDRLYHYTSFDSFLFILKDKAFRLSRTSLLNDKKEKEFCGNKDFYVMSMTTDKEYVSMWSMYGRPSGIKIRIDFSVSLFKECFDSKNIYRDSDCKIRYYYHSRPLFPLPPPAIERCALKDVVYLNRDRSEYRHNGNHFPSIQVSEKGIEQLGGFIKYDAWEFEKETRARVYYEADKDCDYVYVAISDELLRDIKVTFNPWLSIGMKEELRASLKKWGIVCRDSGFDGQIGEL